MPEMLTLPTAEDNLFLKTLPDEEYAELQIALGAQLHEAITYSILQPHILSGLILEQILIQERHIIAEKLPTFLEMGVVASGKNVGSVSMQPDKFKPEVAEVGCAILPDYQRLGYGTAAVKALISHGKTNLGITAIQARIEETNRASNLAAKQMGFVQVGEPVAGVQWYAFDPVDL